MKPTQIMPTVMIVLDIGAAIVCAFQKDFKMTVYWLSAATLTASITF